MQKLTKPMTLDDAIVHANERAAQLSGECATEHRQLAHWLQELSDLRARVAELEGGPKFIAHIKKMSELAEEAGLVEKRKAKAWFTEDAETDKSATTYSAAVAERWAAKGWPVTPLFTHSATAVDINQVSNCLSFFVSVIKSGESWSATCQRELDSARAILRDIEGR